MGEEEGEMKIKAIFDGRPIEAGQDFLDNKMANIMGQFQGFLQASLNDFGEAPPKTFRLRLINDDGSYMEFGKEEPTSNE